MATSTLQRWIYSRRASWRDGEKPILQVNREDNVIVGLVAILSYLGLRSPVTFYNWVETYGCPAIKRPDGQWMTTMTAIDQWIFMAASLDAENRPYSRGQNARYTTSIARLERKRAEGPGKVGPRSDRET